jgi:hypothetical protein
LSDSDSLTQDNFLGNAGSAQANSRPRYPLQVLAPFHLPLLLWAFRYYRYCAMVERFVFELKMVNRVGARYVKGEELSSQVTSTLLSSSNYLVRGY